LVGIFGGGLWIGDGVYCFEVSFPSLLRGGSVF
jgi:hypothetical protein